jgi:2-iminoacetate synthase ThiH
MANTSENGLRSSAGMMINYLYDLEHVESHAQEFHKKQDQLPIGPAIERIVSSDDS